MKKNLLLSGCLLSGCATAGLGLGEAKVAGVPTESIAFQYKQSSPGRGQLLALSEHGERFVGRYTQFIIPEAQRVRPAMTPGARWVGWLVTPTDGKTTQYTGEGVADLRGDRGNELLCQLTLIDGAKGLTQGGRGQCATRDGQQVKATFPGNH